MLNALRLTAGFELTAFEERTGLGATELAAAAAPLIERGLLLRTPAGYRGSPLGLRFLNDLLLEFLPETSEMSDGFTLSIA